MAIGVNMETITKAKIVHKLQSKVGLSGVICEEIVNNFFAQIMNIVCQEKLILKNFGSFKISIKSPRPAINLQTKQAITLPSRKVLRFSPSKILKNLINTKN